jgi:hypothetical protein
MITDRTEPLLGMAHCLSSTLEAGALTLTVADHRVVLLAQLYVMGTTATGGCAFEAADVAAGVELTLGLRVNWLGFRLLRSSQHLRDHHAKAATAFAVGVVQGQDAGVCVQEVATVRCTARVVLFSAPADDQARPGGRLRAAGADPGLSGHES